jgi:hypothetical protein
MECQVDQDQMECQVDQEGQWMADLTLVPLMKRWTWKLQTQQMDLKMVQGQWKNLDLTCPLLKMMVM